jgi:hypothetical protein
MTSKDSLIKQARKENKLLTKQTKSDSEKIALLEVLNIILR